jgi:hypothetical protein
MASAKHFHTARGRRTRWIAGFLAGSDKKDEKKEKQSPENAPDKDKDIAR